MPSLPAHALVLDDDEEIAELIGALARTAGFDPIVTTRPEAFRAALDRAPELILLDLQMPELDGVKVLRMLAEQGCTAGIVLVTGMDQRTIAAAEEYGRSRELNVLGSLQKPFSPPEMLEELRRIRSLSERPTLTDLQTAIDRQELLLYYQPVIRRFADGSWDISAAEALLRWKHPRHGLLSPSEFLKMGEDGGLARPLADFVLQRGIEQLHAWKKQNHDLGLRINIAAQLIADLDFPDRLDVILREHGVDASSLTLEITEAATLEQEASAIDVLTRLRVKQVSLALDDFGIGYSSLTQLFRMPFNEMKIDKSLVLKIPQSEEARIMVETMVGLAHRLSLTACAEGIESSEVLVFLDSIGCDAAQGYFISPPVSGRDLPQILSSWPQVIARTDQAALATVSNLR